MAESRVTRRLVVATWAVALLAVACSGNDPTPSASPDSDSVAIQTTTSLPQEASRWYGSAGWPAIHRDGRNSDTGTVVDPATDLEPTFHVYDDMVIGAVLTTDARGRVYITTPGRAGTDCKVFAIDPVTGAEIWCSAELNGRAVSSSVTVDIDGNLYIADDVAMYSLTAEGEVRWSTPIDGNPLSAQFTPDGRLIFISHIGHIYVVERATGAIVVEHDLLPDESYDPAVANPLDCLLGGAESTCYSANTLAVDPVTGRIYFTFAPPGEPAASLIAMDYTGGSDPALTPAWENHTLDGGSAASPAISLDRTRIYTNDQADNLIALDAATGDTAWEQPLGFSPLGSPSITDGGRIVPTAGGGAWVVAYTDQGDHAEMLWERPDLTHLGVPAQTSDEGPVYVVVGDPDGPGAVQVAVLDGPTGQTLDLIEAPDSGPITIGTTIGPNGHVYVAGLSDGVYAYAPSASEE
jgi:outer membrane protein assembly factor BamB